MTYIIIINSHSQITSIIQNVYFCTIVKTEEHLALLEVHVPIGGCDGLGGGRVFSQWNGEGAAHFSFMT